MSIRYTSCWFIKLLLLTAPEWVAVCSSMTFLVLLGGIPLCVTGFQWYYPHFQWVLFTPAILEGQIKYFPELCYYEKSTEKKLATKVKPHKLVS